MENIDWFFKEIEPVQSAYASPDFSYVIREENSQARILAAQLLFSPVPTNFPERNIRIEKYYAFRGGLKTLATTPRNLIEQLLNGKLAAPSGKLFNLDCAGRAGKPMLSRSMGPLSGLVQQRIPQLTTFLSLPPETHQDDDWAFRSANPPFANVTDLLSYVDLLGVSDGFRVVALPPVVVDGTSRIRGETGHLKIRRGKALLPEGVSLGVIIHADNKIQERIKLSSSSFRWSKSIDSEYIVVGEAEITVPKASIAHCFACYGEQAFHHYWIGDPDASQNPLRTVYELYDPQLSKVSDLLNQSSKRGSTRDHESIVAALLWMLGFAPLHLSAVTDAPDLMAISSDGNIIVIECTLSSLKTDNKIQKLVDRTNEVREALARSGVHGKNCIPLIVTSKSSSRHRGRYRRLHEARCSCVCAGGY